MKKTFQGSPRQIQSGHHPIFHRSAARLLLIPGSFQFALYLVLLGQRRGSPFRPTPVSVVPVVFTRATTVEVRRVQRGEISEQIRSFGTVRAQDNVRVTPQVNMDIVAIRG